MIGGFIGLIIGAIIMIAFNKAFPIRAKVPAWYKE